MPLGRISDKIEGPNFGNVSNSIVVLCEVLVRSIIKVGK